MASKKKLLTSVAALGTAAALLLGGTFAWQSISQTALNENTDFINPGGRLHNDIAPSGNMQTLNYIYVENFTDKDTGEDIYARIRLEEYMELVMNYGAEDKTVEVVKNIAGVKTPKEGVTDVSATGSTQQNKFDYTYEIHLFGEDKTNATDTYWEWTMGHGGTDHAATYGSYMPTFNKNKDSLAADQNGQYSAAIGGITNREENYKDEDGQLYYHGYTESEPKEGWAIYDNDGNKADELSGLTVDDLNKIIDPAENTTGEITSDKVTDKDSVLLLKETHEARSLPATQDFISMEEWFAREEAYRKDCTSTDDEGLPSIDWEKYGEGFEDALGSYWVYDTDGWVYWSSPIHPGEATGPLLESFTLKKEMEDTWYYAINVVAQFITADDLGLTNNTGFYDEEGWYDPADLGEEKAAQFEKMGKAPTDEALSLLQAIGVDITGYNPKSYDLALAENGSGYVTASAGDTITLTGTTEDDLTLSLLMGGNTTQDLTAGVNYRYEDGKLTLLNATLPRAYAVIRVTSDDSTGYILTEPTESYDDPLGDPSLELLDNSPIAEGSSELAAMAYETTTVMSSDGIKIQKWNADESKYEPPTDLTVTLMGDAAVQADNSGYTYSAETGKLVVNDPNYGGKLLLLSSGGSYGVLAVEPLSELTATPASATVNESCLTCTDGHSKYYFTAKLDGKDLSGETAAENLTATYAAGGETKRATVAWDADKKMFSVDVGDLSQFDSTISTGGTAAAPVSVRTRTVPVTLSYAEKTEEGTAGDPIAIETLLAQFDQHVVQLKSNTTVESNSTITIKKGLTHKTYIVLEGSDNTVAGLLEGKTVDNFNEEAVNALFEVGRGGTVNSRLSNALKLSQNSEKTNGNTLCFQTEDGTIELWVDLDTKEVWLVCNTMQGFLVYMIVDNDTYYVNRLTPKAY